MNRERRKQINDVMKRITEGDLKELIDDIKMEIEAIMEEEQDYFDNMPENFQMSDKGEAAEEAVSNLEYAIDGLDPEDLFADILSYLEDAAQ